jgi:threonine/homoserine/homoserine lactone efflux protein
MLLLFGRFKEPARAILGLAGLVTGIVLHLVILALAGGVLLVWAAVRVAGSWRNRRRDRSRASRSEPDGPDR